MFGKGSEQLDDIELDLLVGVGEEGEDAGEVVVVNEGLFGRDELGEAGQGLGG